MATTRVTQRSVSATMMQGLQGNLGRMQKLQEQLSSGKQLSRPSDSPVKTVEAMQFRAGLRRTEQYVRNADDGLALLGLADSALNDGLGMTRRARELVLQGLSDTIADDGRKALAAELRTLRDGVLGVVNTRYLDRPVFGGNGAADVAFDRSTGQYRGDSAVVTRTVAAGTSVAVTTPGTEIFGADGSPSQVLDVLEGLADALEAGGPGLHAALNGGLVNLDEAMGRMINALGEVGARFNRVESARGAAQDQILRMTTSLSEVEDIDLPKTIVDLQMQEVAYKAALGATARVVQPSLLDFLR
jgi:flagellar hook-associated protein 3 FlgL